MEGRVERMFSLVNEFNLLLYKDMDCSKPDNHPYIGVLGERNKLQNLFM